MDNHDIALLSDFIKNALYFTMPFIIFFILVDFSFGILGIYSPQMNVFLLSLPFKSFFSILLLLIFLDILVHIAKGSMNEFIAIFR